jgi:hypothetical protein
MSEFRHIENVPLRRDVKFVWVTGGDILPTITTLSVGPLAIGAVGVAGTSDSVNESGGAVGAEGFGAFKVAQVMMLAVAKRQSIPNAHR